MRHTQLAVILLSALFISAVNTAAQDPAAIEASLALDRPTLALI